MANALLKAFIIPGTLATAISFPQMRARSPDEFFQMYAGQKTLPPEPSGQTETVVPKTYLHVSVDEAHGLFREFVEKWTNDTMFESDPLKILMHPAYLRILALGATVLPLIFDELSAGDGARWLPALDVITLGRVNPVKPGHEDDANLMCEDWLDWGRQNGIAI